MLEERINKRLDEDMDNEIDWIVCPIEELLDNETPCWLSATEDVVYLLNGWYTVENHHHKVEFLSQLDVIQGKLNMNELPF